MHLAQAIRKFLQYPENLRRFVFGELHQLVVRLHRFEGLDKHGLPRAAGAVHHALHAAPVLRAHGNHEAVVAQRDVVFSRLRLPGPQNLF